MTLKAFFQRFQLEYLLNVLQSAFRRFPLTVLCCLAGTLLGVLSVHDVKIFSDDMMARVCLFLSFGGVGFTAATLFAESRGLKPGAQAALQLAAGAVIAAFAFLPEYFSAAMLFFGAALCLAMLYAPYVARRGSTEDSFWYFNYSNGVAIVISGISTLILCGGLAAILGSVDYLFELDIPGKFYGDIWIIGCGFFSTILFLSYVPRQFDFAPEECRLMPGIFFIANYIVVPLVLIMTWVLYAYFAKIVLKWELPRGGLAYMVTGFGSAGIAARLAIFPMRQTGTKLLQQFYKYFYHLLPVPLGLLGMGLYTRITQYGMTEERYAVGLCLIWLTGLCLFALLRRGRTHIKYIPVALGLLFLLASFGPWGAVPVATASQLAKLESLLAKNNMWQNGKVVKAEKDVSFDDRQQISSTLDFLAEDSHKAALAPLIEPFKPALDKDRTLTEPCTRHFTGCYEGYDRPEKIMTAWNLKYVGSWEREENNENFTLRLKDYNYYADNLIRVAPYKFVANVNASSYSADWSSEQTASENGKPVLKLTFALTRGGIFSIKKEGGATVAFNLKDLAEKFRAEKLSDVPAERAGELALSAETPGLAAQIRINGFDTSMSGGVLLFNSATMTVLLTP